MCGGYNYNVFKKAAELEKNFKDHGYEVVRYVSGNKGVGYYNFRSELPDIIPNLTLSYMGSPFDTNFLISNSIYMLMYEAMRYCVI